MAAPIPLGLVFAALLPAATLACNSAELVPVHGSARGDVVLRQQGLELLAHRSAEDKPWQVPHTFTPVRITLRNTGPAPVHVDLGDIQLTPASADQPGSVAAVEPMLIEPRRRLASLGMDPGSPFIAVQSLGSSSGPRMGRTETLLIEPPYQSAFAASLASRRGDGGREEILGSAFLGGTIRSGETREGFVYFPELPRDTQRWTLRIGLRASAKSPPSRIVEIGYALLEG